jgi:hypothetical protein
VITIGIGLAAGLLILAGVTRAAVYFCDGNPFRREYSGYRPPQNRS